MNEFANKIWQKAIQEDLEDRFAFIEEHVKLREKQVKEEIKARAEQLEKELAEKSIKEIAEEMATLERKNQVQKLSLEMKTERLKSLDKIRDIILEEYGLSD